MASGPKVSVILELLDKMTQPLNGAKSAVTGFGAKLKGLGSEAMQLLNNKLIQGVGLAGLIQGVRKSVEVANEFEASLRKLEGTAKITGVPLEYLQAIASKAKDQFKLSAIQANDFAVEMAKLATKAGDVGQAAPALAAFLDIGAARGLTASETLKAVQQAILGIDEGTDKLFNANPSVLYKEYADAIGTTAGKLTDAQKAQALLNAALTDGGRVVGAYGEYLNSAAGRQEQLNNAIIEAAAEFGAALLPAVVALTPAATTAAKGIGGLVNVVQTYSVALGTVFFTVLDVLGGVAKTLWNVVTLDFKEAFDTVTATTRKVKDNLSSSWQATVGIWKEGSGEVVETERDFQSLLTAIRGNSTRERAEADAAAGKALLKRLDTLNDEILTKQLQVELGLTEQQAKALLQRQRDLGQASAFQVRTVTDAYARLDQLNTMLAAGFGNTITPALRRTTTEFRELDIAARTVPVVLDDVATSAGSAAGATDRVGESLAGTVRSAADAAHGLGLIDDAGKGVVNTMLNVGSAIADAIKGGWTAGGVVGVIAGVGSLLKGLFGGKSPAQLAAERELRKNTETIAENSRRVGDLTRLSTSGGKLASVQEVLGGLASEISDLGKTGGGALGDKARQGRFTGQLAGALAGVGLGIGDLDSVAKDLGITIRNGEGAFIVQGLRDLITLLGEIEPTKYAETFEGARDKLRSEVDLFDLSDAEQATRLAAIAGGSLGSGVIGQRLGGLDFNTPEGRAAALDAIRQLFTDLPGLSAGDLGGLTGSQFVSVLTDLKSLLSSEAVTGGVPVDDGLGEGGGTTGTGGTVPVPSVSLADLVNVATQSDGYLARIADYTSVLPTWTAPAGSTGFGAPAGVTVTIGEVVINAAAGADGTKIAADFGQAMNEELGRLAIEWRRTQGSAER